MIFVQAAFECEARHVGAFLAAQFFFFDSKEDGLFLDQSDRSTAAKGGDAQDVHELGAQGNRFWLPQTDQMSAVRAHRTDRKPLVVAKLQESSRKDSFQTEPEWTPDRWRSDAA